MSDLPRAVGFYQRVFDLSIVSEDEENEIIRLGHRDQILVLLRHEATPGAIDHSALGIEGFDREATTRELEARGVTPEPANIDFGFHIKDPDGAIRGPELTGQLAGRPQC